MKKLDVNALDAHRGGADAPTGGRVNSGPGRLLVAVYALFALAATGRSVMQISEYFDRAPVPYLLSALAAVIYIVATVALSRGDRTSVRVAGATIAIELVGVIAVGLWSTLDPGFFHDKTVWSHFGQGYGYVPLVLPVIGLWWLRRRSRPVADGLAGSGSSVSSVSPPRRSGRPAEGPLR